MYLMSLALRYIQGIYIYILWIDFYHIVGFYFHFLFLLSIDMIVPIKVLLNILKLVCILMNVNF
jgi:hypothetical protein